MKFFLHGVPDTPAMWQPLLRELDLGSTPNRALALPGFTTPAPPSFKPTKEAYVDWLIGEMEAAGGGIDLVGHDWGALLVVRAASLRPDLVRSWAVSNAVPDPDYRWHRAARIWQTPLLGEFAMLSTSRKRLCEGLESQGMPRALAEAEATAWSASMRKCILKLYRSARHAGTEWMDDLQNLPERGLVFWGVKDVFVPVETAERFCARTGAPLYRAEAAAHWAVVERAEMFAELLHKHWSAKQA